MRTGRTEIQKTQIINWVAKNGRLPTEEEVAALCGVGTDRAKTLLVEVGKDMAEIKKGLAEEVRELIGQRLRELLAGEGEKPISQSNLVALARFFLPAKQEVKQEGSVEYRLVIEPPEEPDAESDS